jgi:hypothetical protein
MVTPKALRAAPPKILENYVASISHGPPEAFPDSVFSESDYSVDGNTIVAITSPASLYLDGRFTKPLGFDLTLNSVKYNTINFTEHGWLTLATSSPTSGTDWSGIRSPTTTDVIFLNYLMNTGKFIDDRILLAPWFDATAQIPKTIDVLASSLAYNGTLNTTDEVNDIRSGKDTRNWPYSTIDRGVRSKNFFDSKKGKYMLVRWTNTQVNASNSGGLDPRYTFNQKLKFEVAIFESGRIEYRYWPLETYEQGDLTREPSAAVVAVIWNGTTAATENRFRDFAPLLGYGTNRVISPLGGAAYDSSYSESTTDGSTYTTTFSHRITTEYWPKNGATITFAPPTKSAKFLPKKTAKDLSNYRQLTASPGMFDDRKSYFYTPEGTTTSVAMPSTISDRLQGQGSSQVDVSSRQLLFTSGSITIEGRQSQAALAEIDAQIDYLDKVNKSSDFSFNEAEKNYAETSSNSSFYTTGSSTELFGYDFATPLKSKTQFTLNFPVSKPITMPFSTASFYYFNKSRQSWDSYGTSTPIRNVGFGGYGTGDPGTDIASARSSFGGTVQLPVAETSIGFDAIGLKIVSGNLNYNSEFAGSRTAGVGYYLNLSGPSSDIDSTTPLEILALTPASLTRPSNDEIVKEMCSRNYVNSLTDSGEMFPSSDCQFTLGNEYPFLIEKIVVSLPLYVSGSWFNDLTTYNRAFATVAPLVPKPEFSLAGQRAIGPIDFGGPALTFAIHSPKRSGKTNERSYLDLIASGTITHEFDNKHEIVLKKDPGMLYYCLRPEGFLAFSTPTTVIKGQLENSDYVFNGNVNLEMTPQICGGVSICRNVVSSSIKTSKVIAETYLSSSFLQTYGEELCSGFVDTGNFNLYRDPPTRVYIQQLSPLQRGTTRFEANGKSLLSTNFANFNLEKQVKNPLYINDATDTDLSNLYSVINNPTFIGQILEVVCGYSTVDHKQSPYLILPGEKISISISKTRPVIQKFTERLGGDDGVSSYSPASSAILTGSHNSVVLTTGSLSLTFYGSYIREGAGYNP